MPQAKVCLEHRLRPREMYLAGTKYVAETRREDGR